MMILDRLFRRKIIIGIHGLENKPPQKLLEKWWKESIREGLKTIGYKKRFFNFQLVYWADLLHETPLNPEEKNEKSEHFLPNPYLPGDPSQYEKYSPSRIKQKVLQRLEKRMDKIFFQEKSFINYDYFADKLVANLFKDLDYYYHKECPVPKFKELRAKDAIRERLARMLKKHRYKRILLIAHSMGTIIAYDVLTQSVPNIQINTFITIGSPLGLPIIIKKIMSEQNSAQKKDWHAPAPENITSCWRNFSDLDDRVCISYTLSDDYTKNSRGIGPEDTVVFNNYKRNKKKDAHNSYGYCRAPEVARVLQDFFTG